LVERIEFGLIHRRLDRERPGNIDAEKADVDTGHLMPDEEDRLRRQRQFLNQFADF
jgi:hypothetical protein